MHVSILRAIKSQHSSSASKSFYHNPNIQVLSKYNFHDSSATSKSAPPLSFRAETFYTAMQFVLINYRRSSPTPTIQHDLPAERWVSRNGKLARQVFSFHTVHGQRQRRVTTFSEKTPPPATKISANLSPRAPIRLDRTSPPVRKAARQSIHAPFSS